MINLNGCTVGETPTFASILNRNEGIKEILFEEWEPSDTSAWIEQIFKPFEWDSDGECPDADLPNCHFPESHRYGCGCSEDEPAESTGSMYFDASVRALQDKQSA